MRTGINLCQSRNSNPIYCKGNFNSRNQNQKNIFQKFITKSKQENKISVKLSDVENHDHFVNNVPNLSIIDDILDYYRNNESANRNSNLNSCQKLKEDEKLFCW